MRIVSTRQAALDHVKPLEVQAAIADLSQRYLLFHAGAVALHGRGVILPAPGGSGKSTLVGALVADGFAYFNDDIAVVDPADRSLRPFPKGPAIKRGSRRALLPLYPALKGQRSQAYPDGTRIWHLPLPAEAWPDGPVPLRLLVVPRYVRRAPTRLTPIDRSAALIHLSSQSFNVLAGGPAAFGQMLELLRQVQCFELTYSRLDEAVARLRELASGAGA